MGPRPITLTKLLLVTIVSTIWVGSGFLDAPAQTSSAPVLSHDQWHAVIDIVANDPDTFAGFSVDPSTSVATVYLTEGTKGSGPATRAMQSIQRVAASSRGNAPIKWTLELALGRHSLRELNSAMEEATNNSSWRSVANPYLAEWHVDPALNAVRIGVTQITPELSAAAKALFGDLAVMAVGERLITTNRQNQFDGSPWWAGDGIKDGSGVGCTGGFEVTLHGGPTMLTAGHCYSNNTTVYQPYAGRCLGTVFNQVNGGYTYDAEAISIRYCNPYDTVAGYAWYAGGASRAIGGLAHAYVGDQACFDGAVTEENCSGYETNADICAVGTNGITYCHLAQARSTNFTSLAQLGDSGGPVYEISGQRIYAQGLIQGINPSDGGKTAYFTPMWRIMQDNPGYTFVTCGC